MDYHILSVSTLKEMSNDIDMEIQKTTSRAKQLMEQKEIIDLIILYRDNKNNNKDNNKNNTYKTD